jgi:hypothetical protein
MLSQRFHLKTRHKTLRRDSGSSIDATNGDYVEEDCPELTPQASITASNRPTGDVGESESAERSGVWFSSMSTCLK